MLLLGGLLNKPTGGSYNYIQTGSYPKTGALRRDPDVQPEGFAGFNLTQITERCTPPYSTFHWEATFPDREDSDYFPPQAISIVDGTDIPPGVVPADVEGLGTNIRSWTHDSVERWCQQCVTFGGGVLAQDSVSIANYMSRTIVNVE